MPPIELQTHGGTAVLRMAHGKVNALDTELCRALVAALQEVEGAGHRAVVLTGTGNAFCAGVDLLRVRDGGADYLADFLPALSDAFLALFDCRLPVVAAINGHAIAGGAVLAAACDRRVGNGERGLFGWTELLVGVPFPIAALEIMRCAYGASLLPTVTMPGGTYTGEQALELGLVDELARQDAVLPRAVELADQLGAVPPAAFAHTKSQLHRPVNERIAEHRAADDARLTQLWSAPRTLDSIAAYVRSALGSAQR